MNSGDRPGDWLGYAPGESPIRLGGPNSPKKKTMNWRVSRDMQASKDELQSEDTANTKDPTTSRSVPPPVPVDLSASEGSDEVEVVEEVEEDGPVFEVVEYEDDDDSEYEEEVVEESEGGNRGTGSEGTDDDSVFDPLPPPIEIPNALKPVHMREPETETVSSTMKREDGSIDDDATQTNEKEDEDQAKRRTVNSLRPQTLRGHSNDGMQDMSDHIRRGKRSNSVVKKSDGNDEEQQEIKEAPRVSTNSIRPAIIRGHSCEDDIQAMNEAVSAPRGGRRPERHEEDKQETVSEPTVSSLRPETLRGHSFDGDIPDTNKSRPRGGKRPEASNCSNDEHRATDDPSTPIQSAKPSPGSPRNEVPVSPGSRSIPTTPTTPKTPYRRGEDIAPAAPSYTRVDNDGIEHKEYTWEKPAWAMKSPLKSTAKGDKLKRGSDIARPIGGIKPVP